MFPVDFSVISLLMTDPGPEQEGRRGHCLFCCFLLVHWAGGGKEEGRNEMSELLLLPFFERCVQGIILEDDGEVVPTVCTAWPKHCALVWGNSCGLWRHYENIGLLWWLQKIPRYMVMYL